MSHNKLGTKDWAGNSVSKVGNVNNDGYTQIWDKVALNGFAGFKILT